MDCKTFFIELIKATAWPGIVLFLLFRYGRQISKILIVLTKVLRRVNTFKYGDWALATESVSAAIDIKEKKADKAQEALSDPKTTANEREQLAKELRESTEEAARLRAALIRLEPPVDETRKNRFSPAIRHRAKVILFRAIAQIITPKKVLDLYKTGYINDLEEAANRIIEESLMPGNKSSEISIGTIAINCNAGLIDENQKITARGIQELITQAKGLLDRP